jgi:hypothetical protein
MRIFYVARSANSAGSTEQAVAFFKEEAAANQVKDILSETCREGYYRTTWKEMEGTPSEATTKGVVIYVCINQWAGELIVDSIHSDSEKAEKALNQGRGATGEYAVRQVPLLQ